MKVYLVYGLTKDDSCDESYVKKAFKDKEKIFHDIIYYSNSSSLSRSCCSLDFSFSVTLKTLASLLRVSC